MSDIFEDAGMTDDDLLAMLEAYEEAKREAEVMEQELRAYVYDQMWSCHYFFTSLINSMFPAVSNFDELFFGDLKQNL